ncbi:MAG: membrane protein insertion efficiency factor YidD [Gammaproteobacteria bacterium]|nr:membrane protein insertion efficiency factor YidD [Gammaproteobacteria bacterium]
MQKTLIALMRGYRYAVSPLLGNHCRFHPSCSAYAEEAFVVHGAALGVWLAAKRLVRCHPWCAGGHDPVPPHPRVAATDDPKDGGDRAASGTAAEARHG